MFNIKDGKKAVIYAREVIESYIKKDAIISSDFKGIFDILNRADLAKFAKQEFSTSERQSDYDWIANFIVNYKEDTNN